MDQKMVVGAGIGSNGVLSQKLTTNNWNYYTHLLLLTYQSFGVVYGDLSTSPLYVYKSAFSRGLDNFHDEETVFGVFSLIFWTLTLIPLLKYVLIVLAADDNGEGGTCALYSLLCRHAKFSLLPNQQAADEELSTYFKPGYTSRSAMPSKFKRFLEKHKNARNCLLLLVLFGACMVICNCILTPAISVLSSISGLQVRSQHIYNGHVAFIACIVLVVLFCLQRRITQKVAFLFAPIVVIWLLCIGAIGLYNVIHWNPRIYTALSPVYIFKFFKRTGKDAWISLAGILLCTTGTEAMFADLGHFNHTSIRVAFVIVYPCLVLQYMGQAAFLSKNFYAIPISFYESIPDLVFWPVFVLATLASIIASQAIISATFSVVKQCHGLGCFPRIKLVPTSTKIYSQIYIPEINWILMILCLAVTIGFPDTTTIGHAYGIACIFLMFVTTWLMALIIIFVWQKHIFIAILFVFFFGSIEAVYLSSSIMKFQQGGWVPITLAFIFMFVMFVWHYGTRRKYHFDLQNKVSMKWILTLGPSLGIVRVPGIGLIYTELVSGVPAIFSHFVTNLPAFHQVLVFVCIKSVPVPFVPQKERYLIGRIGPCSYRMYRCIARYGYKEVPKDAVNFENNLVMSIAEFIQMEANELTRTEAYADGRMAVVRTKRFGSPLIMRDADGNEPETSIRTRSSKSDILRSLQSLYEQESPVVSNKRNVRFELPDTGTYMDPQMREELETLVSAKQAGVAYVMGHSYIKARKSSSFMKKFAIDVAYSFLRKNCRSPAVVLSIPHISLIEVGMSYYV